MSLESLDNPEESFNKKEFNSIVDDNYGFIRPVEKESFFTFLLEGSIINTKDYHRDYYEGSYNF